MPARRVSCAGRCGRQIMHNPATSLPPGEAMCRSCRRLRRVRSCARCRSFFDPVRPQIKTCTACRSAAKLCEGCGCAFVKAQAHARFCSEQCRVQSNGKRRYRRSEINWQSVAERDGWRCHICGGQTNREYKNGRDGDPTVDHLIPVSDGGLHTWENVALAHNKCNWGRGAAGIAQLRLVP